MTTMIGAAARSIGFSLFAAASLAVALLEGAALFESRRAQSWPVVAGRVTESAFARGCGRGGGNYSARVRYAYERAGARYEGTRIAFGDPECGSEDAARELAARFPVGMTVRVHVNPADSREAALMLRVSDDTMLVLALMSFLTLLGGMGAQVSFMRWRAAKAR
jgi:hypothetical protein